MCSERRREVEAGILLYLKDLAMQLVPANYADKRGQLNILFVLPIFVYVYLIKIRPNE